MALHYLELKRIGMLDKFVDNVCLMRDSGCSYTIECTPTDELEPYIDELAAFCIKHFGAKCHLTIARDDLTNKKNVLSKKTFEEYCKVWNQFESNMFSFKKDIFLRKCKEFCYAGCWSLYVDLGTGMTKPCYGQMCNQNIFKEPNKEIIFEPVGHHCTQPYCYNGHAYLALGEIPELETPTYSEIRNRKCIDGTEWEQSELKEAFSTKLYTTNEIWDAEKIRHYESMYFFRMLRTSIYDFPELKEKLIERIKGICKKK